MAIIKVSNNCTYFKWSEAEPGDFFEGFYMESKPSAKFPENQNHYFETKDGRRFSLNGNANLDNALEKIKKGTWVEVTYQGKIVLENGLRKGSQCHQLDIGYDPDSIHPLHGGSSAAMENVEYKNSAMNKSAEAKPEETEQKPTSEQKAAPPALVKPDAAPPAQPAKEAAPEQPAAPAAPAAKRRVF